LILSIIDGVLLALTATWNNFVDNILRDLGILKSESVDNSIVPDMMDAIQDEMIGGFAETAAAVSRFVDFSLDKLSMLKEGMSSPGMVAAPGVTRSATVNMGGVTIHGGMGMKAFEGRVRRIVAGAVG
jgi:hypothetical protein